jgi:tetratricopeptide (TPR) repeat protein
MESARKTFPYGEDEMRYTMTRHRRLTALWATALLGLAPAALAAPEAAPGIDKPPPAAALVDPAAGPSLDLDDPVEPLTPLRPRGGRETDRVQAFGLFAAARVAEQKQDYPRSLRLYQRAWRLDPEAALALREIVPLAFNLDRQAEAVRYALIMAEREPTDATMLRRLALYLTEEGETQRALALYEKALPLEAAEKPAGAVAPLRLEMGRLAFLTKHYDEAARQFEKVREALDDQASGLDAATRKSLLSKPEMTYQLFGEGFLEAGRLDQARAAFDKAHAAKADAGQYAYNLARVLAREKQPAQALAKLQIFFDAHLSNQGTAPYQLLAALLEQVGQENQWTARMEKLAAADPNNLPLSYALAERYRKDGAFDKAEPIHAKLIQDHPSRPPMEAYQNLVDIYRQQKNDEKLLATLGDVAGRTGSLAALGANGDALLADSDTVKRLIALSDTRATSDADKLPYGARLATGLLALEIKDPQAAEKFFELAMKAESTKTGDLLVSWGVELFSDGMYDGAIKIFRRALAEKALPEKDPRLHFYLAGALEMNGQTDEAIVEAQQAAQLQSDAPRFASRVAWIQYHAKRYEDARASYLGLIERHDKTHDSPEVREALREARLAISNLCVIEKKMDESQEWIEQVLDEFPEDAGALNDLGYLWADEGKHVERALAMIRKAVEEDPKNLAYRDSLGWALYRVGRPEEALAELNVAAGVDDPDGVILDHLAEVLLKTGNNSAAVEQWNRAAAYFDKHGEPDKAKQSRDRIAQAQAATDKK